MPTDKERAEVMRELAAELSEPAAPWVAESYWNSSALMHKADELDPPKPTYADGTVAWITLESGSRWLATRREGKGWVLGGCSSAVYQPTKVEPLRVLAADEIAIPVVTKATNALIHDANHLEREVGYGCNSSAVLRSYVEAIEAAKAGDAK